LVRNLVLQARKQRDLPVSSSFLAHWRRRRARAGDDGTVIGEEHVVMLAGESAHRLGERYVAGTVRDDRKRLPASTY